jgi:hypothetical protein
MASSTLALEKNWDRIGTSSKNFYMEFLKRCLKNHKFICDPFVIGTSVFVSEE